MTQKQSAKFAKSAQSPKSLESADSTCTFTVRIEGDVARVNINLQPATKGE